jgi:hypothetical protein
MIRSRKFIAGCYIIALTSLFVSCDDSAGPSVRRAEDSVILPPNCVPRPLRIDRDRSMNGPLRIHPGNPRYFIDGDGNAILLTGSHTWSNLQDYGYAEPLSQPRSWPYWTMTHSPIVQRAWS